MSPITVNLNGRPVTIPDGNIDAVGDIQALAKEIDVGDNFLFELLNGVQVSGSTISLDELIKKAVDKAPGTEVDAETLLKKAESIEGKLPTIKQAIAKLTKDVEAAQKKADAPGSTPADQAALTKVKQDLEIAQTLETTLKSELEQATQQLQSTLTNKSITLNDANKTAIQQFIDKQAAANPSAGKALGGGNPAPGGATQPQTPQAPQGGGAGKAMGGGKAEDYGYGQNPGFGMPQFNPVAMAGAKFMHDSVGDIYDIQSDQKKRQQMMQLFFFYAKMAMSGDVGAMYQFMRFIGFIIGRDKAMQNVWMGTKLIQLQEVSRAATQELLNMDVKSGSDQAATDSQTEWQKKLQGIKSEEGIVATSQKLIGQMMEEFTQVVETLTNVQKSLLDVNGKIMSNLSVWR